MNLEQMYPSKWAKAGDLQGQTIPVKITRVVMEDVGNDDGAKPVVYFEGMDKGLVLNKTNAMSIGLVHGDNTDAWAGKTIELFPAVVLFQGQNVPCIRVRPVAQAYAQAFAGTPQQPAPSRPQAAVGPGTQAATTAQAPLATPEAYGAGPAPAPSNGAPPAGQPMATSPDDLDDEIKF